MGSGYTFSGTKSYGVPSVVYKEVAVQPVQPVEIVKPVHKKIHKEINIESVNEVNPLPLTPVNNLKAEAPATVIVKEVSKLRDAFQAYRRKNYKTKFHNFMSSLFRFPFISPPEEYDESWSEPRHVFTTL